MVTTENVISVLLASPSVSLRAEIISALPGGFFAEPVSVATLETARSFLKDHPAAVVVMGEDASFSDAELLAREECLGVLLPVSPSSYADVAEKAASFGIITIARPMDPFLLRQTFGLFAAMERKFRRLQNRAEDLQSQMDEIRLVNRAKLLLVERLKMREPEAHRFIEKSAMDRCVKRSKIAEDIIRTYEI